VITGAKPAFGRKGGGLASLDVAASYACRTRNNRRGARLSEHAKGNAIDISGFTMRDGTRVSLLSDWGTRKHGSSLRKMWRSACGPFGVVLGPEADRFHRDHFPLMSRTSGGRFAVSGSPVAARVPRGLTQTG
jgi:hypothetical protein